MRETERGGKLRCMCVCVQSYPRSDCEFEGTTVSGVSMEEAGEEWRCVCVCV